MKHPPITISEKMQGRGRLGYPKILIFNLLDYMKIFNNWWVLVLFKLGFVRGVDLKLKDGGIVAKKNRDEYAKIFPLLTLQESAKRYPHLHIKINKHTINVGSAVFNYSTDRERQILIGLLKDVILGAYAWLNVKNKIVVDIGGYVGDTALYFALNGAKKVYSLEPYPYSFNMLLKNVKASRLSNKVTVINAGIGAKDDSTRIEQTYKSDGGFELKSFKRGKNVPIICFNTLLKTYNINDAVLKMDCEGCEYPSILNSSRETLRKFSQIVMEYHYGYQTLVKYLKSCGFRVRHTMPNYGYKPDHSIYGGYIYAERIDRW